QAVISELEKMNDEELYADLGQRLHVLRFEPAAAGQFVPAIAPTAEALGPLEDLRAFGRRYFERVERQADNLICGNDPELREDREEITRSLGLGREAFASTMTTFLIAQLGLAPIIAPVVAVLVVRLVVQPAYGSLCDVWGQRFGVPQGEA